MVKSYPAPDWLFAEDLIVKLDNWVLEFITDMNISRDLLSYGELHSAGDIRNPTNRIIVERYAKKNTEVDLELSFQAPERISTAFEGTIKFRTDYKTFYSVDSGIYTIFYFDVIEERT